MFKPDTCCTIAPYFEIQDGKLEEFKALEPKFLAKSKSESGCVHYAFSFHGNIAHVREGYDDANALIMHLQSISDLLAEALKIAKIIRMEMHGLATELEKLREPLAAFAPQFFELDPGGIRRSSEA